MFWNTNFEVRKVCKLYFLLPIGLLHLCSNHYYHCLSFPKLGNNSIYFRAIQDNRYPSILQSLANTLYQQWFTNSHQWQRKISVLSLYLSTWKYILQNSGKFFDTLQHLLFTAFPFCFPLIRLMVPWGHRPRYMRQISMVLSIDLLIDAYLK